MTATLVCTRFGISHLELEGTELYSYIPLPVAPVSTRTEKTPGGGLDGGTSIEPAAGCDPDYNEA